MHLLILLLVALLVLFGPSWWVKRTLKKYTRPDDRYQGTGGEFAVHLLDRLGLEQVNVEQTERGDHYDPERRAVCLSPDNYKSRSLTAVTIAAHEVGHAIQHADGYRAMQIRTALAKGLGPLQKLATGLFLFGPVIGLLARSPTIALLSVGLAVLMMLANALFHLITLPVEWDASFARAMPLLRSYLIPADVPHAQRILRAAALTYVAQALISTLLAWRWLRV